MPQDIASLAFNIDSSQATQSHQALDTMAQRARLADEGFRSLTQSSSLMNSGFASLTGSMGTTSTQLSYMAASLQSVVTQLQSARDQLSLTGAAFETFGHARTQLEALSTSLGTGAVAMESYTRSAAQLHMTSLETVSGVQRITAAIEAQTAAGRQLRAVMQDYGVSLAGLTSGDADRVLTQFIDRMRGVQSSPTTTRAIQEVLGPLGTDSLSSVMSPTYEPVEQRRNRLRVEEVQRNVAEMVDSAMVTIRSVRAGMDQADDLRRSYDLSRLSRDQIGELTARMGGVGLAQRDEASVLRYLNTEAPDALRQAARRPTTGQQFGLPDWMADRNRGALGRYVDSTTNGMMSARLDNVYAQYLEDISRTPSLTPGGITGWMTHTGGALGLPSINDIYRGLNLGDTPLTGQDQTWGRWLSSMPYLQRGINTVGTAAGFDMTRQLSGDGRPEDPNIAIMQRRALAETLGNAGFGEAGRWAQADDRIRGLDRGAVAPTLRRDANGALIQVAPGAISDTLASMRTWWRSAAGGDQENDIEADARFDNRRDLDVQARTDATNPGAGTERENAMERWVLSLPRERQGLARALLQFGQNAGVSTQQWAANRISPDEILAGRMNRPGSLSPIMRDSFLRGRAGARDNFITGTVSDLAVDQETQQAIRGAIPEGTAAVERATAYWKAYNDELRRSGDEAQASASAMAAVTRAMERQTTVAAERLNTLRRQNQEQATAAQAIDAAGTDPVARRVAEINAGITSEAENFARETGGSRTAYAAEQRGALGVSATRAGGQMLADASKQVEDQRLITGLAGAQADIQARLISDLQVERDFVKQIAEAKTAAREDDGRALSVVEGQVRAVKDLRAEYDLARRSAENWNAARDANFNASFQEYLNTLPPEQRRAAIAQRPAMEAAQRSGGSLNNPLGLRFAGQDGASNVNGFAAFPTPEAGEAAAQRQIGLYADRGINTLRGLITKWAPPSENNTEGYIRNVSQWTGIDPDAPIDLRDTALVQRIMTAMRRHEGMSGNAGTSLPTADPAITALAAAGLRSQAANEAGQNISAQESFDVEQQRRVAQIRMTMAGGGDFGRRVAAAGVVDTTSPIGAQDAQRRVLGEVTNERLSLTQQSSQVALQIQNVNGLAEAWRVGRQAGEEFERHLTNDNMIRAIDVMIAKYPTLTAQFQALKKELQDLNPELDKLAANKARQAFDQNVSGAWKDQNEMLSATIDAGPFASAQTLGRARAEILARRDVEATRLSDNPLSIEEARSAHQTNETLQQQAKDVEEVRQGFLQFQSAAESAFESAVIGGKKFSAVLQGLAQDFERFLLKQFVERPLMNLVQQGVDGAMGALGLGSLFSAGGGAAAGAAAGAVGNAALERVPMTMMGATGLVMSGAQPMRYAASGEFLTRPTTFMAAGGPVIGGEIDQEAILPLKRDANGNLGVRTSGGGGGGPSIMVHAPITIQGSAISKDGQMDPKAAANVQRQLEQIHYQAFRNALANERRNGGILTVDI